METFDAHQANFKPAYCELVDELAHKTWRALSARRNGDCLARLWLQGMS